MNVRISDKESILQVSENDDDDNNNDDDYYFAVYHQKSSVKTPNS